MKSTEVFKLLARAGILVNSVVRRGDVLHVKGCEVADAANPLGQVWPAAAKAINEGTDNRYVAELQEQGTKKTKLGLYHYVKFKAVPKP